MTDRQLINIAYDMVEKAYAPYSDFKVGTALECRDGTIFTGCNVENGAYGSTICAEACAVCKAVSSGHTDFARLAIVPSKGGYCMPCGNCRQILSEFATDIEILCANAKGGYVSYKLKELLPCTYVYER